MTGWTAEDVLKAVNRVRERMAHGPQRCLVLHIEQRAALESLPWAGSLLFGMEVYIGQSAFEVADILRELSEAGRNPVHISSGSAAVDALVMACLEEP